jgi:hypothetical protein
MGRGMDDETDSPYVADSGADWYVEAVEAAGRRSLERLCLGDHLKSGHV